MPRSELCRTRLTEAVALGIEEKGTDDGKPTESRLDQM